MRMTDIHRCEIRPGRLVEWTLSPRTLDIAAALPEDARPPAYIQESHIRTARSVREDGLFVPTWLGTAFDLPGPADLDALERALRGWTLRHETLRSGFRWADEEMHRFTLDEDDVSLHRQVVGDFADTNALVRYLQDRFDVAADALGWPNLIYAAVVRDDGVSVYMAFDHSNVDAYSLQRIPGEIRELYTADVTGRPAAGTPPGSYVDFCEQERTSADGIDDTHAIVDRWREFIGRCDGRLPEFPVDLGLRPGDPLPTQKLV
ncbi:condensation domain-containing protein, partial [Streptomyces sp. NPDC005071]